MPTVVTADQRRLIVSKMIEQKMSTVAIATKLNMPISVIRNDRLMLSVPHPKEVTKYAPLEDGPNEGLVGSYSMSVNTRRMLVARMFNRGMNDVEIARKLKVSSQTVGRDRQAMNLIPESPKIALNARRAQVKSMTNDGMSLTQIANDLGVSRMTVIRDREAVGCKQDSEEAEEEIRVRRSKVKPLIEAGHSYKKIAGMLDVAQMTIIRDAEAIGIYTANSKMNHKGNVAKRREAVKESFEKGKLAPEIATMVNASVMTVYRDLEALGLKGA